MRGQSDRKDFDYAGFNVERIAKKWKLDERDPNDFSVDKRSNLSMEEFYEKYMLWGRPVVVTDATEGWNMMKWDTTYVRKHYPHFLESKLHITVDGTNESNDLMKEYGYPYLLANTSEYSNVPSEAFGGQPRILDHVRICRDASRLYKTHAYKRMHVNYIHTPQGMLYPQEAGRGVEPHKDSGCFSSFSAQIWGEKTWKLWLLPVVESDLEVLQKHTPENSGINWFARFPKSNQTNYYEVSPIMTMANGTALALCLLMSSTQFKGHCKAWRNFALHK